MTVLMIAPSWLGDAMISHALIQKINQTYRCQVDIICRAYLEPLYQLMPGVGKIYPTQDQSGQINLRACFALAKTIRHQYDTAFILPDKFKAAIIPWLAGIPNRIGSIGECRYGLINRVIQFEHQEPHTVLNYINLLRTTSSPETLASCPRPRLQLKASGIPKHLTKKPYIVFAPGASFGPSKCWPAASFQALGVMLQKSYHIVLLGSPSDRAIADDINLPDHICTNLTGKIPLQEAIAILDQAVLLVSNDAGLMHVAAALNVPIVALFGPTALDKCPPLSPDATLLSLKLPCQPCQQKQCPLSHRRCLDDLHPKTVFQAIEQKCVSC